jgi:xylulokinase
MADEKKYIISHDMGTGGSKAVLTDTAGKILAYRFAPFSTDYCRPGWAEQNPGDWWQAVTKSTRELIDSTGTKPGEILGIGFATQMLGVLPVDSAGKPLRPAIIWIDCRAEEQARRLVKRLGGERVVLRVAGAVPSGKDVICKIQWLRDEEPDIFKETHKILDVDGYLVYRATGNMIIDQTNAAATGLLDNKTRDWSPLFARVLKVPLEKLPPVKRSIDVVGGLSPGAAEEMGLNPGTPVIAGMGDVPSAATGSGALDDGDCHIYIGTSGWLCISVAKPRNLGKFGIASIASADPDGFLMIGETETAGACLKWFAEQLAKKEEWDRTRGEMEIFAILDEVVERVPAGARKVIFNPWMFGERAPVTDVTLRGAFLNLSLESNREDLLRAIYEGVAMNFRWLLEAVKNAGFACSRVRAIGGGAKSDVWMQILADVTGQTIEPVEEPQEAGAVGCALAVAVALNVYKNYKQLKDVVRVRKVFQPDKNNQAIYDGLFLAFKKSYRKLSGIYRKINEPA